MDTLSIGSFNLEILTTAKAANGCRVFTVKATFDKTQYEGEIFDIFDGDGTLCVKPQSYVYINNLIVISSMFNLYKSQIVKWMEAYSRWHQLAEKKG